MTIAATATMCHQTLTWLRRATRLIPAMFMASWMSMRMPIVRSWPVRIAVPPAARITVVLS